MGCENGEGTQTEAAVLLLSPRSLVRGRVGGGERSRTAKPLKFSLPIVRQLADSACGGFEWGTKVLRFVFNRFALEQNGNARKDFQAKPDPALPEIQKMKEKNLGVLYSAKRSAAGEFGEFSEVSIKILLKPRSNFVQETPNEKYSKISFEYFSFGVF